MRRLSSRKKEHTLTITTMKSGHSLKTIKKNKMKRTSSRAGKERKNTKKEAIKEVQKIRREQQLRGIWKQYQIGCPKLKRIRNEEMTEEEIQSYYKQH